MKKEKLIALVTGAQKGSSAAMEELFAAFYNDVYYFTLKTLQDPNTACDITQETFLEIIRTIGNLQEPAAFVTWMKRITYHQCTRYFAKRKEVLVEEDEEGNTIFDTLADESEGAIPAEVYEKEEFRSTILGIVNELTEQQRSAVLLYYFDELTIPQIAQIQGVSEGTVKSRLNYARKAIKKSVEDYEKKHDVKLYSFSMLPLLLLFFRKESMPKDRAAQVQATVTQAARGAAKAGSALAGVPLAAKIFAGVVAVAMAAGIGFVLLKPSGEDIPQPSAPEIIPTVSKTEEIPEETFPVEVSPEEKSVKNQISSEVRLWRENVVSLSFTDLPVPEGVETMDLSENDMGQVVAWLEQDDAREEAYHVYVTSADGGKIYAPRDASGFLSEFPDLVMVDLSNLDTAETENMAGFFRDCPSLEKVDLSGLDTSGVTDISRLFFGCTALQEVDLTGFDTSNITAMRGVFHGCESLKRLDLSGWDTSCVTDMSLMFYECYGLEELDVSGFDTARVTNMNGMFGDCSELRYVDVSGFDTSAVTQMDAMFYRCYALTGLDVSGFDTARVETLSAMFDCCKSLTYLDVSRWNTSAVTDMSQTFGNCISLAELDVSAWDTSSVTDMMNMFTDCRNLTSLDVSRWNTARVTDMYGMFYYCRRLAFLDVRNWNTANVEDMESMFAMCDSLAAPDLSGWVIPEDCDLGLE